MSRKSMLSGFDPMGGHRFSENDMRKIKKDHCASSWLSAGQRWEAVASQSRGAFKSVSRF